MTHVCRGVKTSQWVCQHVITVGSSGLQDLADSYLYTVPGRLGVAVYVHKNPPINMCYKLVVVSSCFQHSAEFY